LFWTLTKTCAVGLLTDPLRLLWNLQEIPRHLSQPFSLSHPSLPETEDFAQLPRSTDAGVCIRTNIWHFFLSSVSAAVMTTAIEIAGHGTILIAVGQYRRERQATGLANRIGDEGLQTHFERRASLAKLRRGRGEIPGRNGCD